MNPFMEYDSLFKVVAKGKNKFNKDEFTELIECLMAKAKEAKKKADNSKDKFDEWLKALKSNMRNVESNIDNGWKTLDEKEA